MPDVDVRALVDPDSGQIDLAVAQFPSLASATRFASHEEALAAGGLDALLIASPHTQHKRQALDGFSAGLHVLVDKPLATTVEDTKELIAARDRSGKVGAVSYQRHGLAPFAWVREQVLSGRYGKVLAFNSHLTQNWKQLTVGSWRQDPALSGGGQLNDSGSHMIDVLLWMTGLRAERVTAMVDHRGTPVDITSLVTVAFEGGAYGSITIVGDATLWHERHQVWLEKGAILVEGEEVTVIDDQGRRFQSQAWPGSVSPDRNFIDAIRRGDPVMAPFECGLRTIELTEAAWRSGAQGGVPVIVA